MGAAVGGGRQMTPMPMQGTGFADPVRDVHLHGFARAQSQGRSEVRTVDTQCLGLNPIEESGESLLQHEIVCAYPIAHLAGHAGRDRKRLGVGGEVCGSKNPAPRTPPCERRGRGQTGTAHQHPR